MKVKFEVVKGVEGPSLYICDPHGGHRLSGPKPWGGGQTMYSFQVDLDELKQEIASLEEASCEK